MRMRWSVGLGTLLALLAGAAHAQWIGAGDLIVSYGDELWRIDAETGDRRRISPPPHLATLLDAQGSDQVAVDPEGAFYLMNDGDLIEITATTGSQRVVRERIANCSFPAICGYTENPLPLGGNPRGVDANFGPSYNVGDRVDILVGCEDAVYRVIREGGEVSTSTSWFDSPTEEFPFQGPLLASTGFGIWLAGPDLHDTGTLPTPVFLPAIEAPGEITGIDYGDGALYAVTRPGYGSPAAGVWQAGVGGFLPLTQGGFLRAPTGIAVDPFVFGRIWVADRGAGLPGQNRIIRVDYDGVDWRQTLFTELPDEAELHGIAVSPVAFAPEPGSSALAGGSLATLLSVARARGGRRVRRSLPARR